jgi:holin-like protein
MMITFSVLLSHLSLLFVPAGVGVMVHWGRIGHDWLPITVALVLSTLLSLGLTALFMQVLIRFTSAKG